MLSEKGLDLGDVRCDCYAGTGLCEKSGRIIESLSPRDLAPRAEKGETWPLVRANGGEFELRSRPRPAGKGNYGV